MGETKTRKIEKLLKSVKSPRKEPYHYDVKQLAASIKRYGLMQYPLVSEKGVLLEGRMRLLALQQLGFKMAKVRIINEDTYNHHAVSSDRS